MNSPTDLRVDRSLELLARLKSTLADFTKRETQLTGDLRARRFASDRRFREGTEKTRTRAESQIAAKQTESAEHETRLRETYEARRARVQRLQMVGLRNLPKRAQAAKQQWMGDLQKQQFRAERKRTAGQKAANAAFNQFNKSLAEQRAVLAEEETRARKVFRGYGIFQRVLKARAGDWDLSEFGQEQLLGELTSRLSQNAEQLERSASRAIPRLFGVVPMAVTVPVVVVAGAGIAFALGPQSFGVAGAVTLLLTLAISLIYLIGGAQSKNAAIQIATSLREAKQLAQASEGAAESIRAAERARLEEEFEEVAEAVRGQWERSGTIEAEFEATARRKIETQIPRIFSKGAEMLVPRLRAVGDDREEKLAHFTAESAARTEQFTEAHDSEIAAIDAEESSRWAELVADWQREITPIFAAVAEMNAATSATFPPWDSVFVEKWLPPIEFTAATKFARLELDVADALPKDPRLALEDRRPACPAGATAAGETPAFRVEIPLALTFPQQGSVLFETHESGGPAIIGAINNIVLRLLTTTPPGKLAFTFFDPVGLGENFAGVMHLADYEESLVHRRIWTQRDQIEERMAELSEHIEKVIQMYLRNEYASITEYNAQAGSVAEKYHFLVVADFPAQFSETAARRLQSIALSGPRCGIFTIIHWDKRHALPDGFVADELRKNSICLQLENGAFVAGGQTSQPGVSSSHEVLLDPPPTPEIAVALVHKIGKSSIDSNRVEVPFAQIAPPPDQLWTGDTTSELRIAIGRTGATKHQFLAIGKGTRQHALFAGKTGSGKSTLFHVIITNLALLCSPEQVEFYLIDFKKGVEFKCYATKRLPHARVIAIESDREFALSVLQRVDDELKRRGDLFRKLGVQDIAGYKKAGGTEPIPRSLLMIDEFQEFFVEDDSVAQTASLLFDRIVRQGRAFGIHVLLGSQSLGGAYSLARATIGQMVIRVALQCNEADAYLIMDDSNSAPRLLTRPGEGIYNDAGGAVEGNSPFQVVWLPDEERDEWLEKVSAQAEKHHIRRRTPVVFEGNAPADIRENDPLAILLERKSGVSREAVTSGLAGGTPAFPSVARMWLGAPNSIKGPTEAVFRRQSGNHLLIVGQREEPALTMLGLGLLGLAAQFPVGGAKFVLLHQAAPGTSDDDFLNAILAAIPHPVTVARGTEISEVMNDLAAELTARLSGDADFTAKERRSEEEEEEGSAGGAASSEPGHRSGETDTEEPTPSPLRSFAPSRLKNSVPPPIFLLISGLHKFKKLRHEDDFSFSSGDTEASPGAQLNEIITDGSSHGIHIIATIDTFNNVSRFMNRKALSEFEMRVVFQMSANDSASLIDSPKAGALGLHRALFYNEQEGSLETFRPYALPDPAWLSRSALDTR